MKALLDTDTLSDLLRATSPEVVARAEEYRKKEGVLAISTITVVEVVYGWSRAGTPKRARLFRRWIRHAKVLPLEREIAWLAGEIGGALTRTGQPIGFADVAIAATALHHRRALVTSNTKHFERVRTVGFELELDNWREPLPQR